ncbi:MAG: glycyl-radical enzyme activating protein [Eubacteriales bacterium]
MIQRFCMHDGPGIRTVVFFKGCRLNCVWCHNPETKGAGQEIYYTPSQCIGCGACAAVCRHGAHVLMPEGHVYDRSKCRLCEVCTHACPTGALEAVSRLMSIDEILSEVMRDKAFYGEQGGLTISGGEPMMHPSATIALLQAAKEQGLTTAVETSGYFDPAWLPSLCRHTDTLLWDLKDTDPTRHQNNTGASNRRILDSLTLADNLHPHLVLRCILLRGINDDDAHIRAVAALYRQLKHCQRVEFFSYHPMGSDKSERLGTPAPGEPAWMVSKEALTEVKSAFWNYVNA